MVSSSMKSGLLLGFGALLAATGAIMTVYWPTIYFNQLKQMLVLTEQSMSFSVWQETPIPMYLEVFMWNISNVREIQAGAGDVKPHLTQMGPYVFRESHSKVNLTWNDNSTVSFLNQRFWHFEPDMSNGTLADNVTSINVIIATVGYSMRHYPLVLRPLVNVLLSRLHESMFVTHNVSAWVFDGYEDPVLQLAHNFSIPIDIPYDRFGWFYGRNGSREFDGRFNMHTGAADIERLGNIERWDDMARTPYFRDSCADVRGSTGELFPPNYLQDEVTIFASDLCTYLPLHRQSEVTVEGISGVMYGANSSVFDNGYHYPSMACYCAEQRDEDCMLPGVLNVTSCRHGAPAFVSFPHFYGADPSYLEKVTGLSPNDDHQFRMGLELFTGIPLSVSAQLQINILVRRVTGMGLINVLPADTLVPMFWFRQEVALTPEYASQASLALTLRYAVIIAMYVLTALGLLLLVSGIAVLVRRLLRSPDTTPLVVSESSSD